MKLFNIKIILIIFFILIINNYGEEINNISYPEIRTAIDSKNIYLAKKELNKYFPENPNDPALSFYQAEIWVLEGEVEYSKGNLRNSFEFFSKAHQVWPSHPIIRSRMEELKGRNLINSRIKSEPTKSAPFMLGVPEKKEDKSILNYKLGELFENFTKESSGKDNSNTESKSNLKIIYISDSTNLNEIKDTLNEINNKIELLNDKPEIIHYEKNMFNKYFQMNYILFGICFFLIFIIIKLNSSIKVLKSRIKK